MRFDYFVVALQELYNINGQSLISCSDNTGLISGFWNIGEPSDVHGDEDCVSMEYAENDRQWNDVQCNTELGFICQYPSAT